MKCWISLLQQRSLLPQIASWAKLAEVAFDALFIVRWLEPPGAQTLGSLFSFLPVFGGCHPLQPSIRGWRSPSVMAISPSDHPLQHKRWSVLRFALKSARACRTPALARTRPAHHGKKLLPFSERLYFTFMGGQVMGSQLISNAVRSFFLATVLTGLLAGSDAEAASYQKTDGTIIDPILDKSGAAHSYSGHLEPDADLANADLYGAVLTNADLAGANLWHVNLGNANLAYADLSDADLSDAILSDADLYSANLTAARLFNADLSDAILYYAILSGANFGNASLAGADLSKANLYYADLHNTDLSNANLYGAWLANADLSNADLYGADLYGADLSDANLAYANLSNANLYGAILYGADLSDATLAYADLSNANLYGAILRSAILSYADLSYADLFNADLTGADLYSANLTYAWGVEFSTGSPYYYPNTTLPAGFDPVAQGWILAPYCDFTPDAACDLTDINQMYQAGNLVTGVTTSGSIGRLDLVDNNTLDASDITEWLAQAATANDHGSTYLRGDTELDRDVDITDFNALASHFDPTGDGDPQNGPLWNEGNFDGDNDTDITDFNLLAANFSPAGYATSAIPEPTSLLLASLAVVLVSVSCRLSKNG